MKNDVSEHFFYIKMKRKSYLHRGYHNSKNKQRRSWIEWVNSGSGGTVQKKFL